MARVETLKDVPSSELQKVVDDFKSEGAEVETIPQKNGLWTVKATFPDE